MKRLVYQYWDGEEYDWVKISKKRMETYANKQGAEYLFEKNKKYESNYYEKLRIVLENDFQKYDEILYTDVDVIVENFEKNIFDEKINDVGLVREKAYPNMTNTPYHTTDRIQREYQTITDLYKLKIARDEHKNIIVYNTGVMLWKRSGLDKAKERFKDWLKFYKDNRFIKGMNLDQPFINCNLIQSGIEVTELGIEYNCFPRPSWKDGHFPGAVFVHYTGGKKKYIKDQYP